MPDPATTLALSAARRGDAVGAARLLEAAAAAGDGEAAFMLAQWRLAGDVIRRDLSVARQWYGRAAELGVPSAADAYIALLANGAGGSGRRWQEALDTLARSSTANPRSRREVALVAAMKIDGDGNPTAHAASTNLSQSPDIRAFPGFLTPDECRFLVKHAEPLLQDAVVVDPRTGALIRHPIRTARSAAFPFTAESPLLHAINRRIAAATGTSYEQGEPTQILSYGPGEEYRLHSDAIAGDPNQRVATFLVTLAAGFSGGATRFPRLGLSWRGKIGDALFFRNVDAAGQADRNADHAGEAVSGGRKIILSKWIRARPLDLSGPPGRPL